MTRTAAVLVALLVAFWAVVYLPHLLAGQTLPARDVGMTQIPWRTVWRAQVAAGSPPLWDPYSNGGRPLLADPNTMAAYPGTLLFLLASPEVAAGAHVALHHLLLILGCYLLARRSGAAPAPSAIAAAAVGTCGVAWSAVTFLNFQASLAWGVGALATAVPAPEPGRPALRRGLAGGALIGVSFLGGEPVTAGLAALAWVVVVSATWRPLPVTAVAAMGASAVALAAPVLMPLLAVYPETVRGSITPAPGALAADALAPRRFLELFFPNLLGPPLADSAHGFWAAASFPWQRYYPVIFVGALPLLCLPFAVRLRRRLAPWWWIATGGVACAILIAIPTVATRAQELPFVGSTRYAIKLLALVVLALPPLVAAGWEGMAARWKGAGRRAARTVAVVVLALAPMVVAPDRVLRPLLATLYPRSAAALNDVPTSTLRRAALTDWTALLLPPAALALAGPLPLLGTAAVLAANALPGAGTLLFADASAWSQPPPAFAALPPRPVLAVIQPPMADGHAGGPPIQRYWDSHVELLPEAGTRWGAAYVLTRGPDGLEPIRQDLLAAAATRMSTPERARLARALGATAVLAHDPIIGWTGTPVGELWVGRVERPSPPAYLARRLLPAETVLAAATTMAAEGFRAGEDAVVDGTGAVRDAGGGTVVEDRGLPHRRLFNITAEGAGLLVVQQSFMRCWRATVDGTPSSVEPANWANIAVRVPAGNHRVALFIDPTPYRVGLLGPLVLALVALFSRRVGTWPGRSGSSGGAGRSTPATPPAS